MNQNNPVKLLKDQADKHHESALSAIVDGNYEQAEQSTVDALVCHPGLIHIYKTMGKIFEQQGDKKKAERCFIGELPDCVNDKYFAQRTDLTPEYERKYYQETVKIPISAPKAITPAKLNLFNPKSMTLSEAVVDSVEQGTLWFDGFNRFLFDCNEQAIAEHSRGNEGLIRKVLAEGEPVKVEGRLFFLSNRGFNNYYHWMIDILPSLSLFKKAGYEIQPEDKLLVYNATSSFQKATLELLGFSSEQVLEIRDSSPYYQADEIIMPFFANAMATRMGRWVPEFLKSSFLPNQAANMEKGKQYYIARGNQARNGRSIDNEAELIELLDRYGIEAIYPENYSIQEQAELFAGASLVLATHGAGLTNIIFCNPGTKVIELYGEYMESCYWCISNVCDLDYYTLDCTESRYLDAQNDQYEVRKNDEALRRKGYSVPLAGIEKILDIADVPVKTDLTACT